MCIECSTIGLLFCVGLDSTDLILRITDTNVTDLPSGLLRYLSNQRFSLIDLRKNKLHTLKADVLQFRSHQQQQQRASITSSAAIFSSTSNSQPSTAQSAFQVAGGCQSQVASRMY